MIVQLSSSHIYDIKPFFLDIIPFNQDQWKYQLLKILHNLSNKLRSISP